MSGTSGTVTGVGEVDGEAVSNFVGELEGKATEGLPVGDPVGTLTTGP